MDNIDSFQKEIKFLINSDDRLLILKCLYGSSQSVKSIQNDTKLSNSSISVNISQLEEKGYIYSINDIYYMTNECKILLNTFFKLNDSINVLNDNSDFLNQHKFSENPLDAYKNLDILGKCELIDNSSLDIFNINDLFKLYVKSSKVKVIFPYMHPHSLEILKNPHGDAIRVILEKRVFDVFLKSFDKLMSETNCMSGLSVKYTNKPVNFALIISKESVILGFYRYDGFFDADNVYKSDDEDVKIWANNIFKEYERDGGEYVHY